MLFYLRRIIHMSCLGVLLLGASASVPAKSSAGATASAFMPEVRLRKIHIVRPDLIPYPISYEIDC